MYFGKIAFLISEISRLQLWQEELTVKKNEILVEVNDISKDFFFIKSGAAVISTFIDEKPQIIRLGYKNSGLIAADSFFNSVPTIYQLKTIRETEILKTDLSTIEIIFQQKPELFSAIVIELINQQNERELDLLHHSAIIRFERLLKRSPQVLQEIPHKYIASYLRISPETLSRLLKS